MEIKIISQKENPLFSRKEVSVSVEDTITPSLLDARGIVAKEFKSDESLVRIRKVDTSFGSKIFTVIADVYDSIEEFNRVVKKTKQEIETEKKAIDEAKKTKIEAKAVPEEDKEAVIEAKKAEIEAPVEEVETSVEETSLEENKEKTE